jgi:hypothetical protein
VALGHLVNQLRALDALAIEAHSADDLPSTQDFTNAIGQAIEQSISGRIETFARGPGLPEPNTRPVTGSTPIEIRDRLGPQVVLTSAGDLRPATRPSSVAPAAPPHQVVTRPAPTLDVPPAPRRRAWVWLAAAVGTAAVAVAVALPTFREELASQPAVEPPEPAPQVEVATATVVLTPPAPRATHPGARGDPRPERRAPPGPEPPAAGAPGQRGGLPPRVRPGGVRDPLLLQPGHGGRPNRHPDHPLVRPPPLGGRHTVLIEGTSCPPIERPGSLRRVLPAVMGEIEVEPGASLRIIADFDEGRLIVRRVE